MNIKKFILGTAAGALMLGASIVPALAAQPSSSPAAMPKATGGYGYSIFDVQRYATFNAIETTTTCSNTWDVTGTFNINVNYLGTDYPESLVLTQSGTGITGVSLDTIPPASLFTITGGSVIGNVINIDANQGALVIHMTGTIDADGSMTGTWGDVPPTGSRTGTWASTSGAATKVFGTGCTGKGVFNYSDENGIFYGVDVKYVSVDGNKAWFAGPIVSGNFGNFGSWLFIKVVDNGEPGIGFDTSAGDFPLTEAQAKLAVASHADPVLSATILSGNIQVH